MEDKEIQQMSEFEEDYWWFKGRKKIIQSLLNTQIKDKLNLKILDVGCGSGGTTSILTEFGTVYGIDFSFSALKFSNQRGLKVLKSDVYEMPFSSESFDIVTMFDSLEHIENELKVLSEIKRVMKKNSLLFITVPAYQFLWSNHDEALLHFRRYNSKNLDLVIKNTGLNNIRMSYFVSIIFLPLALFRIFSKLKTNKEKPKPTLIRVPKFIDEILQKLLFFENRLMQKVNLPFGLSLMCIAKK